MPKKKQSASKPNNRHNLAKVLPAFDKAMRTIVATPKAEVERREQAERDAKASNK